MMFCAKLASLVHGDMSKVNETILSRADSRVAMIPEVANHLIESGGKRLRPMMTLATAGLWRDSDKGRHIVQQLCRELLLLESSDWQFLITTGAARDYAESRFVTHLDQFNELAAMWQDLEAKSFLSLEQQARLDEITLRDNVFPDLDPALWATPTKTP